MGIQEAMAGASEQATELFEEQFEKALAVNAIKKKAAAKAAAQVKVKHNASEGTSAGDGKR